MSISSNQKAILIAGMAGLGLFGLDNDYHRVNPSSKLDRVTPKDRKTKSRRLANKQAAKSRAKNRK